MHPDDGLQRVQSDNNDTVTWLEWIAIKWTVDTLDILLLEKPFYITQSQNEI